MDLDKIMNLESALNCATKQNHEQRVINKKLYYENIDLKKQLKLLRVSKCFIVEVRANTGVWTECVLTDTYEKAYDLVKEKYPNNSYGFVEEYEVLTS